MLSGVGCSAVFELQTINIQVGAHIIQVFVRVEFFQQVHLDVSFTIVSDLQIQCEVDSSSLTTSVVECGSTGGIGSVTFTCSIDGTLPEECELH